VRVVCVPCCVVCFAFFVRELVGISGGVEREPAVLF